MKIKILKVDKKFRPKSTWIKFPKHNNDYGVEQDFYDFLKSNEDLLTTDENIADYHFLPIYWTRYFLNNNYGDVDLFKLQNEIMEYVIDPKKTLIICQYADGPLIDTKGMHVFLSSRPINGGAEDIPLISAKHNIPNRVNKEYLACFRGRYETSPYRKMMFDTLTGRNAILLSNRTVSSKRFVKEISASYISLCPRGHGGNSFRFYESMQLGVVPLLFGDIDTRPFKSQINWQDCSIFAANENELMNIFNNLSLEKLTMMGEHAQKVFYEKLNFNMWPQLLIKELENKYE